MRLSLRFLISSTIISGIFICPTTFAVDVYGVFDLRSSLGSAKNGDFTKLRSLNQNQSIGIGQAILRAEAEVTENLTGNLILSAADDRRGILDMTEAWIRWSPTPSSHWKQNLKVGVFFPTLSLENNGPGWTTTRTISSSAVNSWIGEELRTRGLEYSLLRRGRSIGDDYDVGLNASVFNGNDSIGSLLTWRGWRLTDRISGLSEALQLPDLPVYRANGEIPAQTRNIHPFREIDGQLGYQIGAHYAYSDWLKLAIFQYDNRAAPLKVKQGQYAWRTQFQHVSAQVFVNEWEYLFQLMRGSTFMGPRAAGVDFHAWYFLASHPLQTGTITARYDRFANREKDILPTDPNNEHGQGFTIAYNHKITPTLHFIIEFLTVRSMRDQSFTGQGLIGTPIHKRESSVNSALRWRF
jgi:hypothetical protein